MSEGERYDIEAAALCARRDAREPGCLPHHLRCDWVKGSSPHIKRCRLGAGHSEAHIYEKE